MTNLHPSYHNKTVLEFYQDGPTVDDFQEFYQMDTAGNWQQGYICGRLYDGQWRTTWAWDDIRGVILNMKMFNRHADFAAMRYWQQDHEVQS